ALARPGRRLWRQLRVRTARLFRASRRARAQRTQHVPRNGLGDLARGLWGGLRQRPVEPKLWIQRTRFVNVSPARIESRILAGIRRAKRAGKQPVVLLDIDSTLFPTEPRSGAIYHEWARSPESAAFPEARRLLATLPFEKVPWGHRESLVASGLAADHPELDAATKSLTDFWTKRFFTNEAVAKHDRSYPGASAFVKRLHDAGARVIYLTGRDKKTMRDGTLASLANNGLPVPGRDKRVELLMREQGADAAFKGQVAKRFSSGNQQVVAFVDNEPSNLSAVFRVLPKTMQVFFHSTHSKEPATPLQGVYYMKAFPSSAR
ncbi:MAG: HAD family hydrolase, partial [Myxococcales bacterium]|nr:HAD family hydrolase [Myxococcales bacterium]